MIDWYMILNSISFGYELSIQSILYHYPISNFATKLSRAVCFFNVDEHGGKRDKSVTFPLFISHDDHF